MSRIALITLLLLATLKADSCQALDLPAFAPFSREETYATPFGTYAIVAGDFDADGYLDLATTNHLTEVNGGFGLTVYRNNSGLGFVNRTDFTTGQRPFGAVAADLNGDARDDLAVVAYYANNLTVRYALPEGGFSQPTGYMLGGQPWSVVAGDFLGDGRVDLAANHYNITLLEGLASGGFSAAQPLNTGTSGYGNLVAADFNGDGRSDLAQTTGQGAQVQIMYGQLGGGFGASQEFPAGASADKLAAGDINRDGRLDLAVTNWAQKQVTTLFGLPGGDFEPGPRYSLSRTPRSLAFGDFNGDGNVDLAVTETDNSVGLLSILINSGAGAFVQTVSIPINGEGQGIVVADFDHDGGLDLAVTASTQPTNMQSFSVFYNQIPEPTSVRLFVLILMALTTARVQWPPRYFSSDQLRTK